MSGSLVLGDTPVPLLVQFNRNSDFNAVIEVTDSVTNEPLDCAGKTFRIVLEGRDDVLDATVDGHVVTFFSPMATISTFTFGRIGARLVVIEDGQQITWGDGEAVFI